MNEKEFDEAFCKGMDTWQLWTEIALFKMQEDRDILDCQVIIDKIKSTIDDMSREEFIQWNTKYKDYIDRN